MSNRQAMQVSVVISIPTLGTGRLFRTVESCLQEIGRLEQLGEIPIHWSFPVRALETDASFRSRLVPLLRGRIASGRDLLLPRGYAATPHSLLYPEDVEKDLSWAKRNPWGSGIADVYPQADFILFPYSPDWLRENIQSAYESETNPILLTYYDESVRDFHYYLKTNSLMRLDGLHVKGATTGLRQQLLRKYRTSPYPVLVILETLAGRSSGDIRHIFENLAACMHRRFQYRNLAELVADGGVPPLEDPYAFAKGRLSSGTVIPSTVPTTPADVCSRARCGYTRVEISASTRNIRDGGGDPLSGDAGTRDRLLSLAPACNGERGDEPRAEPRRQRNIDFTLKDRRLIADMSGLVTLEDHELSAEFDDGRLTNVLLGGASILCKGSAGSYYAVEGNHRQDATRGGSFSFEGDRIHGLRSTQAIRGMGITKDGSIVTDYFFMEGYRSLFISIGCIFPVFAPHITIDSWACFELPVFTIPAGRSIRAESRLLNGEKYSIDLSRTDVDYVLPGNSFCLKNESHSVFFVMPETERNPLQLLPIRVVRAARKYTVLISPGGSYHPAMGLDFSGYAMRIVIALDVQSKSAERYPVIRSDVYEETGLPGCGRYTEPGGSS